MSMLKPLRSAPVEVQVDVVASYMSHFQEQQNTRFVGIPAVHAHGE